MGYRDEQLALRLKTEAAEDRAAEAERRRLAAQAEVDRLRIELAFSRAAPPDVALAATKRAFLVFIGGLVTFVVLVGTTIAFRRSPCEHVYPPPPLAVPILPAPPPMLPLEEVMHPAGPGARVRWELELVAGTAEFDPADECDLIARIYDGPGIAPALESVALECRGARATRFVSEPARAQRSRVSIGSLGGGPLHRVWLDYDAPVHGIGGRSWRLSVLPERALVAIVSADGRHANYRLAPWSDPELLAVADAPVLPFETVDLPATFTTATFPAGRPGRVIVSPRPEGGCSVFLASHLFVTAWEQAQCEIERGVPTRATAHGSPPLDLRLDEGVGHLGEVELIEFEPVPAE